MILYFCVRPSRRLPTAILAVTYFLLKYIHILGAIVLLGTGGGIAFFMLVAHRSRNAAFIAHTAAVVVLADFVFTATAVVAQPVSGYLLMRELGILFEGWVIASLVLYVVTGVFWLPVVWMQMRMRDLASAAASSGAPLPADYHRLARIWIACGVPGFADHCGARRLRPDR
jgi:uncharacterized membrane protein